MTPNIILPLAISFFTFQQIAYLVDVYRAEAEEYNFILAAVTEGKEAKTNVSLDFRFSSWE